MLLPLLKNDFADIFEAMAGHPVTVTVHLLDPPLREFLPSPEVVLRDYFESQMMAKKEKVQDRKDLLLKKEGIKKS